MQRSTYYEDNYSPEEVEEQFYYGETAYCEVTDHYDWSDNVHGFPTLLAEPDWISCCDDCGPRFAQETVREALRAGLGGAALYERVKAHSEANDYSEELANHIVAALRERLPLPLRPKLSAAPGAAAGVRA